MAEVLGLAVSHYLPMGGLDEDIANAYRGRLKNPDIPASAKDPTSCPSSRKGNGQPLSQPRPPPRLRRHDDQAMGTG